MHLDEERLNDLVDGRLPPDEAARVDAHLARCDLCRRTVREIRALNAELAALPREIRPKRDLRPAPPAADPERSVAAAITEPRRLRRYASAALVLLMAGSAALALLVGSPGPGVGPATAAIESYERAGRALTVEFAARRDHLDPATADLLDRNLAVVETAIRELEGARAESPSDPALAELLESRHRLRLEMLREAVALSTDS